MLHKGLWTTQVLPSREPEGVELGRNRMCTSK